MDFTNHSLYRQQYSNSNSQSESNSNSTVQFSQVVNSLSDLIKQGDDYMPYYAKSYRELGYTKFMWLAGKARAAPEKAPERLFWWMLHNPDVVS